MQLSVRNVVGICAALFVLASGFLLATEAGDAGALLNAFAAQPLVGKLAWIIVVVIALIAVPYAAWLADALLRQRLAADALALRLDGVRQDTKAVAKTQADIEAGVHRLARTDPEDAIGAAQQRLTEAERFAQVQEGRNEIADLPARVDELRGRQTALQQRLAPVLEKRRQIEQLFLELEGRQHDIQRTLAEIAHGDDAAALDVGLKRMADFVAAGQDRCDDFERAAKAMAGLKQDFIALRDRLAPFAAADDGIPARLKELGAMRERLSADIEALLQTPDGALATRVQKLADDRNTLEQRLVQIGEQFSRLATLHEGFAGLFAGLDRALDLLAVGGGGDGETARDFGARIEDVTNFVRTTQAQLEEIERRLAGFQQLQAKLGDLQARLAPLEAADGGIIGLISEIAEARDRLVAKIKRIQESEDGDLGARVQKFSEVRRELEERVTTLTEQMLKLASVRKDIAGLFEKLSAAATASAN